MFDGGTLLGTAGALKRALPVLGEAFFVLYGDSLLTCDLPAIERAFRASGRAGLMTVFRNDDKWDRSNVLFRRPAPALRQGEPDARDAAHRLRPRRADRRRWHRFPPTARSILRRSINACWPTTTWPASRPRIASTKSDRLKASRRRGRSSSARRHEG